MIEQHPYYWAGFVYYGVDIRYDEKAFKKYYDAVNSIHQSISDSIIKSIDRKEVDETLREVIHLLFDKL